MKSMICGVVVSVLLGLVLVALANQNFTYVEASDHALSNNLDEKIDAKALLVSSAEACKLSPSNMNSNRGTSRSKDRRWRCLGDRAAGASRCGQNRACRKVLGDGDNFSGLAME